MNRRNGKLLILISLLVLLLGGALPALGEEGGVKAKKVVIAPFSILSKEGPKDPVLSWLAEGTDEEFHLKLFSLTQLNLVHSLAVRKAMDDAKIANLWDQKDKVVVDLVNRLTMEKNSDRNEAYVFTGAWDRSGETLKFKVRFLKVDYRKKPKEDWDVTVLKTIEKKGTLADIHVWMVQTALEFLDTMGIRPRVNHEADIRRLPTNSTKAFTLVCKARLAIREDNYYRALELYAQALEEDPQYSSCAYELGTLYYLTKEYTNALRAFDKAIDIRGDFQQAYRYKALAQYALNDYAGALKSFKKAVELDAEDAGSTYNISCIYARLGQTAEAIEWLKKAMTMDPSRYRFMAQKDPDLDNIRKDPRFKELLVN